MTYLTGLIEGYAPCGLTRVRLIFPWILHAVQDTSRTITYVFPIQPYSRACQERTEGLTRFLLICTCWSVICLSTQKGFSSVSILTTRFLCLKWAERTGAFLCLFRLFCDSDITTRARTPELGCKLLKYTIESRQVCDDTMGRYLHRRDYPASRQLQMTPVILYHVCMLR